MKPSTFEFVAARFSTKTRQAVFSYALHGLQEKPLRFKETLAFPKGKLHKLPPALQKELLKNVHLVLGLSYYKLSCPKNLKLPYALTPEEATFWQMLYEKGLGEFFFRNQIDFRGLIHFPANQSTKKTSKAKLPCRLPTQERALLGIGGGKDSIVAGEFLKNRKLPMTGFVLETGNPSPVVKNVSKALGLNLLAVHRTLDPKLFKDLPGTFNGHIPISAIFAFVGLLTAALYGYRYTVVANEASSNVGNLTYLGHTINHQWSKSAEFETALQKHIRQTLSPDLSYFSAIRHLYEIRVVEEFVKHPKYFPLFTSCNRSFRVSREKPKTLWCGQCPKCAFVFAELAAFLPPKKLLPLFPQNLFEDTALLPLFKDLAGLGTMKPFDCVGTFEESRAALRLAAKEWGKTPMLKILLPLLQKYFPGDDDAALFKVQAAPTLPAHFGLLGLKNLLLLGYGKEGQATHAYLKKFYPTLPIRIADQAKNPQYLSAQKESELAIKTPGLPSAKVSIPYLTATQIFFAQNRVPLIGVTGSKGKSTTASLIAHLLQKTGIKAQLLGNIGSPMLAALLSKKPAPDLYVLELSSYQLEALEASPQIAVVTNLFPEHMTHHGSLEAYYDAKLNLIKHQSPADVFVVNPAHPLLKTWPQKTSARAEPFSSWTPKNTPLLGEHNRSNLAAALTAVQEARLLLGKKPATKTALQKALNSFKPLHHRLQNVGTFHGITFYDDAISTSPESTIEALKTLSPLAPIGTIFLGGEDRGYTFTELEKALRRHRVKNLILFPETGHRMLASKAGFTVHNAASIPEAVALAYRLTPPGQICLLSTASPHTFGLSFEEKGDRFQEEIRRLAKVLDNTH